jgi:hypothetical protein
MGYSTDLIIFWCGKGGAGFKLEEGGHFLEQNSFGMNIKNAVSGNNNSFSCFNFKKHHKMLSKHFKTLKSSQVN